MAEIDDRDYVAAARLGVFGGDGFDGLKPVATFLGRYAAGAGVWGRCVRLVCSDVVSDEGFCHGVAAVCSGGL